MTKVTQHSIKIITEVSQWQKESSANAEDEETWVASLHQEDPLEEETVTLQYSFLKNSMDREALQAKVVKEWNMTKPLNNNRSLSQKKKKKDHWK